MGQDLFFLAALLFGAILTFVGLTALLPVGIYRKIFGYLWPMGSSESRERALQRRLVGVVITALGFTALREGILVLFERLK